MRTADQLVSSLATDVVGLGITEHLPWDAITLFITGDHAHSRIFNEHASSFRTRVMLIFNDQLQYIPFDKLTSFFVEHLK